MFRSILVATDGSEHARKAVATAGELAAASDARLLLINVIEGARLAPELRRMAEIEHLAEDPPSAALEGMQISNEIEWVKNHAAKTRRVMQALSAHILADAEHEAAEAGAAKIDKRTEEGNPADCIVDCARRENVDLIVLGSRGLSGIKSLLLGSVSHKVSHLAPCSCATVK